MAKNNSEPQGTIYRILTVFPKTIELDELSLQAAADAKTQKVEDSISIEIPLIKINDYIFNRDEIQSMTIDGTEFLPTISLSVIFLTQAFLSKEMPKDGDIISIAIRNKSDVLKMIRNDYVITGVHVAPNFTSNKSPVLITFYGELFIPGLKSQNNDFSFLGTSLEALQDFARKYKLGFASNEDNTNDRQIWLKANISGEQYVRDITSRAWRDTESFYDCWIDVYYNLNFVNLNKQLMSAENDVDITALSANLDTTWTYGTASDSEKSTPMVKVFSNYQSYKTTSFYINKWRPINKSSAITFQIGTKMTCELFEHNKNLYEDENKQKYWAVTIEPTYDRQKVDKAIILRGRASYVPDENNKDLKRVNYNYTELYEKLPWLGIQYTISNSEDDIQNWDGNHHLNYHVARVQNLVNNKELEKLNVFVEVNGTNFGIIKGDKLPVALIKTEVIENMKINQEVGTNDMLDLFYSGWYLVKGFVLNWNNQNKGSIMSNYTQEFILTRREWPAPMPIEPIKTKI